MVRGFTRDVMVRSADAIRNESRKPAEGTHTYEKRQPANAGQPLAVEG